MRCMILLALAALAACDGEGVCTGDVKMLEIQVDMRGIPTEGFIVEAHNLDTGDRVELPLDVNGRAALSESIGGGRVQLKVLFEGALDGHPRVVRWQCDECHCRPEFERVDLDLSGTVMCIPESDHSTIQVVDAVGAPVEGAIVTGRRDGQVVCTSTPTTQGWTFVSDCVQRPATLQVVAELDGRTSAPVDVTWSCHVCGCGGGYETVTLTLL